MSRIRCAVCLLALAGGAAWLYSVWYQQAYAFSRRHPSRRAAQTARRWPRAIPLAPRALPMTFEPNVGQTRAGVQFLARGEGGGVLLDGEGMVFALPTGALGRAHSSGGEVRLRLVQASSAAHTRWKKISPNGSSSRVTGRKRGSHSSGWHKRARPQHWRNLRDKSSRKASDDSAASRSRNLRSSQPRKPLAWQGREELPARANYFLKNDRSKWRTNVPLYEMAEAENVLPGVDLLAYGNGETLEYDLRLAPGVDASKLRLKFSADARPQLAANGDLTLSAATGSVLRMKTPRIYEESASAAPAGTEIPGEPGGQPRQSRERKPVNGGYELEPDGTVGFLLGPHDADATLVIDPSLSVTYSTFLGGSGTETASSIGMDRLGNVYIGGTTVNPATFPEPTMTTLGPGLGLNPTNGAATEYFIAKINPNMGGGSSLVYLTFIGGSGSQGAGLIAVDAAGDVAITGTTTSHDFPVTDGSARTSGGNDVTVSEIDQSGSVLLFSTLFGGSGSESQYAAGVV